MFVHEFAHLRYGVGDEYYQSVFGLGADGKPSACSVKVEPLRSRTTGRYSGFNPNGASASFMWHQFRPNVSALLHAFRFNIKLHSMSTMDKIAAVRSSKQLSLSTLASSPGLVLMLRSDVVTLGSVATSGRIF